MWLFNDFPIEAVRKAHGFAATAEWLDHVRLSSLRLAGGCSASLVSARGLVMTNHHCVRACIEDLSTPKKDYLAAGFLAATDTEEVRCPKVEVNQLVTISDVSERVFAATAKLEGAAFSQALKGELSKIESECATSEQLRCEVVTLFHGGKYHLYKYRRFQDVRLAFAPEFAAAAFGGDPDNFNFPRYGFDVALLRVYEANAPVATPDHLRWATTPAQEGELVFVAGNPGGTERVQTMAQLQLQRDVVLPWAMIRNAELRGVLSEFQKGSPERFRVTRSKLRAVENSLKAMRGQHQALADPAFFARKQKEDEALRAAVTADRKKRGKYADAWPAIAAAVETYRSIFVRYQLLESGAGFSSELFSHARKLVRAADELPKPNDTRLREYTEAKLPELRQGLLREAPVPLELDQATLAFSLTKLRETLGADDPFVREVLGKQSPDELAHSAVTKSRLADPKIRKALLEGGKRAVTGSADPMIKLALATDAAARAVRKTYEDQVESALRKNGQLLAQAHVAVNGTSGYPDATFSPRLSYGQVKGWDEGGRAVPALTDFAGLFARDTGKSPFSVEQSWLNAKAKLTLTTPMNLATTNDIIGGNSGSPIVNREGEVVGLIFDGNLPSLAGRYGYDPLVNRAVGVHASAIIEALEKVYGGGRLVAELRP